MRWLIRAKERDLLRITNELLCPYCNPEGWEDVPMGYKTCEEHAWASRRWYEPWYERYQGIPEQHRYA